MNTDCKHICDCECHTSRGGMHMINCCVTCDECDEHIKRSIIDVHKSQCHAEYDLMMDEQ
jgi:hypothetical protein